MYGLPSLQRDRQDFLYRRQSEQFARIWTEIRSTGRYQETGTPPLSLIHTARGAQAQAWNIGSSSRGAKGYAWLIISGTPS